MTGQLEQLVDHAALDRWADHVADRPLIPHGAAHQAAAALAPEPAR